MFGFINFGAWVRQSVKSGVRARLSCVKLALPRASLRPPFGLFVGSGQAPGAGPPLPLLCRESAEGGGGARRASANVKAS